MPPTCGGRLRHSFGISAIPNLMALVRALMRTIGTLTPACISGAKSGMCSCSKPHTCNFPANESPLSTHNAEADKCCRLKTFAVSAQMVCISGMC